MPLPKSLNAAEELDIGKIRAVSTEIAMPTLPVTQRLLAIWEDNLGLNDQLPQQSAFELDALGDLAPYVYVIDRVWGGSEFRVNYMGAAIIQSLGGTDYTGTVVGDDPDHPSAWRRGIYNTVVNRREPVFTAVSLGDFGRDFLKTECVLLPVADEFGAIVSIVCAAASYPEGPAKDAADA